MPYTKEKYDLPSGFTDLGEEVKPMSMEEMEKPKSDYHYPSLYFENAEGLKNLPREGTATIYFKKTMEKDETTMRDGKTEKRHCVELCICGIKAKGASQMMPMEEEMDDEEAIDSGLEEEEAGMESESKPKTKIEIEIGGEEEED
jgi:hypothetical protein